MADQTKGNSMQLAEMLSDLVSLRVCDPAAALALVSTRPNSTTAPSSNDATEQPQDQDADLKRAKEVVELHYAVKEAHKKGRLTKELMEARAAVERAIG